MVLIHSGTNGMKWGVRRFRNYDGTLTEEGRQRYDYYDNKTDRVYKTARLKQLGEKAYVKSGRWGEMKEDLSKFTNDELRALTERANLEKSYREAFNTTQYTRGKRILEGFKNSTREISTIAGIGKQLLENVNGIKAAIKSAQEASEKDRKRVEEEANNKELSAKYKANDAAVRDFLLEVDSKKRKDASGLINMLTSGKGGKKGVDKPKYGDITPEMLEKIKKMYS